MTQIPIKICGLTRAQDVAAAVQAGANAVGFVLYAPSPRHVTAEQAAELAKMLPAFVTPVLLFVNATEDEITHAAALVPGAWLQFHGDETPDFCQKMAQKFPGPERISPKWDPLVGVRPAHPPIKWVSHGGGGGPLPDPPIYKKTKTNLLMLCGGENRAKRAFGPSTLLFSVRTDGWVGSDHPPPYRTKIKNRLDWYRHTVYWDTP
jgi:hypothetical protein